MEITIQKVNQSLITLEFLQDLDNGVDDITPLITSLEKIKKEIRKVGFSNKFNKQEKELWNNMFKEVLEEDKAQGIQSTGINVLHINE